MTSRTLLNLFLILITATLVLVIIYRPGIAPETPLPNLTGIDPQSVDEIHIKRTGRDDLTLEKRNGHWFLSGSPERPAAELQARTLAGLAGESSITRYPAGELDLEKIGLVNPAARIRLNDTEILHGTTEALDGNRYVRIGNTVHLINDRYHRLVLGDSSTFLSTKLLPDTAEVTRLDLPTLEITRSADGKWTVNPPVPDTDAENVTRLVQAWQNARAVYVSAYPETTTQSQGRLTLHLAGEEAAVVFDIISRSPELVLARPAWKVRYHMGGDDAERLLELPKSATEPVPDGG